MYHVHCRQFLLLIIFLGFLFPIFLLPFSASCVEQWAMQYVLENIFKNDSP